VHDIKRRDVSDLLFESAKQRKPHSSAKLLKVVKRFLGWCMGRAIIELSPAAGIRSEVKVASRDRVLDDEELAKVLRGPLQIGDPYAGIIELLALTGQRREEVARMTWDEIDFEQSTWTLQASRTKNGRPHIVHLAASAKRVLERIEGRSQFVFVVLKRPFQSFGQYKRELDAAAGVPNWRMHDLRRTCVSGMARLGIAPHVADKVLNHQSGTISGVAAVYQRHEFLAERKEALNRWAAHVEQLVEISRAEPFSRAEPASDLFRHAAAV
jgi:integrase